MNKLTKQYKIMNRAKVGMIKALSGFATESTGVGNGEKSLKNRRMN
jgi:hypothetical protein